MAGNKTTPNDQSVEQFLHALADASQQRDSFALLEMLREVTGLEPTMWGSGIVGFGMRHYKYASGREGDMILAGFAPRKQNLALYGMGSVDRASDLLARLGKYTTGKGCLYIKRLADVDLPTLRRLLATAFAHQQEHHITETAWTVWSKKNEEAL
jgi:hypothetical protein